MRRPFIKKFAPNYELSLIALPTVLIVFIFNYVPLYGLILPFIDYKYEGFFKSPWVGLKNFEYLFNANIIVTITRNTIVTNFLMIAVGTAVTLIFALLMFELTRRVAKVYQTILFYPYFMSWVIVAYVVFALLSMDNGVINRVLQSMGLEPVMWYNEPKYWLAILILSNTWKWVGYGTVIYYAALMGVDPTYYESAKLDGASRIRQMFHISLPMLKPLIIIMTIIQIGRIFYSDFGLFYNVTLDSPLLYPATDVLDTYVYRALRTTGDIGMASAANFYQSVVGLILVLMTNYIVKKTDPENKLF